jgi:hypothetical protein
MQREEMDSALQEAVTTVERVGEVLHALTLEQWQPTLEDERRRALETEAAASYVWAVVVVKQAITVARAASAASTACGDVYGPVTRAEALAHFGYLLEHVGAATPAAAVSHRI